MSKQKDLPAIYLTVTTDLSYDQRMIRICTSLSEAGYMVVLVGRKKNTSVALTSQPFEQKRLNCFFEKGFLMYASYNICLFFFLLFKKIDAVCAIDLDTILPCLFISKIKKITRIYDAHELFCEMKEVVSRPSRYRFWKRIEKYAVPQFKNGYTVNQAIADAFKNMYGVKYDVIRSIALLRGENTSAGTGNYILYQGAVNEGRCFECLIPAMKKVSLPLIICGTGNYFEQSLELSRSNGVDEKITFKGNLLPDEMREITNAANIGITLFENKGMSNYLSLANRFFDYVHAGVPQICSDFPCYREINEKYEVAVLVSDLSAENIANVLNELIADKERWNRLHENCITAAKDLNWQKEAEKLTAFYKTIIG